MVVVRKDAVVRVAVRMANKAQGRDKGRGHA